MEEAGFELVALAGGIHSLRSLANGQTFHPVVGPVAEARAIHVDGPRLVERANAADRPFVIWDVGLGAAANALTAVDALSAGYRGSAEILLLSFDQTTAPLDFALAHAEPLGYVPPYETAVRALRENGGTVLPLKRASLHWRVCLEDFPALLAGPADLPAPHAVFFDPYSPAANPEMWTLGVFSALRARTHPDTPCLVTHYSRSTAVRVTMLLAGFHVGIGGSTGEKDETTVAANTPALLERPLGRGWLEKKVHASTNAAPLRSASENTRGPISDEDYERLRAHPQFA